MNPLKIWWRLRAWWHANLYYPTEFTPTGGGLLVTCSCGGHGQVTSNGDGTHRVTDVTCPLWKWRRRCKPVLLPIARTVRP